MDKKSSRQILYKPGKLVSEQLEEKANKVDKINTTKPHKKPKIEAEHKKELTIQEKSERLYNWLKERPFINLNGVCKKIGFDRANFMKWMSRGKSLNQELLDKIVAELKNYGYAE